MTKKKVGVMFSGQMRNVQLGYRYHYSSFIEPNLENYEFYNFVHTWFDYNDVGKQYDLAKAVATGDNSLKSGVPTSGNVVESVYCLYNPVKMLLEKQIEFDERDYNDHKSAYIIPRFSLSKNYSIKRVCELKKQYELENGFVFDAIYSTRFDIGRTKKVNLDDFDMNSYNCSEYGVYMGEGVDVTNAIMSSKIFDLFGSFYHSIDECYRNYNVEFCDERLMHKFLDLNWVNINRTDKLNDFTLLRTNE